MKNYERKACYHETDQMGVIHHSNYVKWMEETRIFFLDSIGLSYNKMEKLGIISPVNSIAVDYKKSVYFDQVVVIYIKIKAYSGVRLEFEYEIRDKVTNELCATAYSKHCFIADNKIISLKKTYPEYHKVLEDCCASV